MGRKQMSVFEKPRLMVAAPRKSSGKTMVSIGLGAALRQRGYVVQPFKKGPDFIDPMWLSAACGRRCRNLDFFMMSRQGIEAQFLRHGQGADLCLVEGNMGLYDGLEADGSDSGAALAALLRLPVLLVVDCTGIARAAAPLVWGHLNFPGHPLEMAGVVLNNISSARQERKIRESLQQCCPDARVVGVLAKGDELTVHERHLGLIPPTEAEALERNVAAIAQWVGQRFDLDGILELARKAVEPMPGQDDLPLPKEREKGYIPDFTKQFHPPLSGETTGSSDRIQGVPAGGVAVGGSPLRVAIASDRAFHFYYPDNLEALVDQGIALVPCNLLEDPRLPEVDGLFIGGGFPEVFLEKLAANTAMLASVRAAALAGLPIYAECGGLMYLARSIRWNDNRATMAGVLPFDVEMRRRPVGYGYMEIEGSGCLPWPPPGQRVRCHEFHYSTVVDASEKLSYGYRVLRGHGMDGHFDGVVHHNVLASYAHIHTLGAPGWAEFLAGFWRNGLKINR